MATQLSSFFFTSEASQWSCPYFNGSKCAPPNACAHNSTLARGYCCDSFGPDSVCWALGISCAPDGSTITCGGSEEYCCYAALETCTRTPDQFNNCWLTGTNILANADVTKLNQTFSSLNSASPSATFFTFTPNAYLVTSFMSSDSASSSSIFSHTSSSVSAGLASTASSPLSPVTTTPQTSPTLSSQGSSLPGGAIAGIVIGALVTLSLLTGAFYIGRWSKKTQDLSSKRTFASPQGLSAVDLKYELPDHPNNRLELASEPRQELPEDHVGNR
ncbi:hypothetical protein EV356DRAFT_232139 [Viridothelium virens]|uniref:Mid2 domain-containing protein n=1 Tax=Viridothelium virens TaxID=1048519 RepID=A0A6A6H4U8_VIRVR|nr:hypothetical protein EV356DRAFT_232139 [Viridothelium virens]